MFLPLISFLLVQTALAAVLQRQALEPQDAAGSSRCGRQANGAVYSCPYSEPCCHTNGYCVGSADIYCHVAEACVKRYSAPSNQCQAADESEDADLAIPTSSGKFCGVDDSRIMLGACPNKVGYKCCSAR
jgi:hypothetical protein